ncbi:MAG: glycosyltransferase [Parachlamydiaceae bacterium]|nr:glycosyltransferase [Parachlamydiaceae bacterium]
MYFIRLLLCTFFMLLFYRPELQAKVALPYALNKKPTVCLNMIVKNESHVIIRCLDSVLPMIDYWVICDTGSTDGTQKIIKDYMQEKNIPGELHEHEWVNFGHNREEALRLALFKADYVIFMDADDILNFDDDFKMPRLIHDCYMVRSKAGSTEYLLTRIIKSSLNWHWHGVLHEYVYSENVKQCALLGGVEYIYICDGARANDPERFLKDAKILHAALEKEPDNARYMFYLGQTYASAHKQEEALEYYQKRVDMGGWEEEVFWAMVQIAQLKISLGHDEKSVEESFIKALKFRPTRPEPYYYLIREARIKGEFQKGYELGREVIKMPPSKDVLFIEAKSYDALKLEFALCAWWAGHYQECLDATLDLLKKDLPPELRHYVIEAHKAAQEKLQEKDINDAIDDIFASD